MYNEKELIWISSLGAISLFGPCLDFVQFDEINLVLNNKLEFSESMLKKSVNNRVIDTRIKLFLEFFLFDCIDRSYSEIEFLNRVCGLLDRENKQYFSFYSNIFMLISDSDDAFKGIIKKNKIKEYSECVKDYSMIIGRDSYYAYNIANGISLLRIALYLNVISNEIYIEHILNISRLVKKNFVSYYDFGSQVVAIQHILSYYDCMQQDFSRLKCKDQLAYVMYGLWEYIPWMGRLPV